MAINTSNRDEVRAAYRQLWRSADADRPEWIGGSVKKCRPGTLSGRSTNKQLGAINFARLLSGLTPLALDNDTVAEAQAAAIMMTAKDAVNHYPPRSWPCWSQAGYDAAGISTSTKASAASQRRQDRVLSRRLGQDQLRPSATAAGSSTPT